MEVLSILGAVLTWTGYVIGVESKKNNPKIYSAFMVAAGITFMLIGLSAEIGKEVSIDHLNGKPLYEKQYVYRVNDTIPVDSVYVKIKY